MILYMEFIMKDGLVFENEHLVYYRKGRPYHAGVVKVNGDIYYISRHGRAVKGQHIVHGEMTNGILKRGTYTFGDDYKLIKGSYKPKKNSTDTSQKGKLKLDKKKKKRIVIGSIVLAVLLVTAVVADSIIKSYNDRNDNKAEISEAVVLPSFDEEVLLCTQRAKKLYDNEMEVVDAVKDGNGYRPFVFEYQIRDDGELYISENSDFTDSMKFVLPRKENSVSVDNLKTGTTYYYKVIVDDEVYTDNFKTAESTRFVNIPGAYNTRDIGGYKTADGKTVKQGLLIRGSELDGLVELSYYLKDSDVQMVQDTFGFIYDLDLREAKVHVGKYVPRFGENVGHKFYDALAYGGIFSEEGASVVKEVFSDMANPKNYPMYLHCTYGADRTGTMIFLLQGLLGMTEDDMIREYRTTAFFMPSFAESENMDIIIEGLKGYEGDTVAEKVEKYMLDVGVTEAEIQSIRNIFLEN